MMFGGELIQNIKNRVKEKSMTGISFSEMVSYKRPEGSYTQQKFCNRYLKPVFGNPDEFGNYIKIIGNKPNIAFMAHHDTVHNSAGKQIIELQGGIVSTLNGNCLGADDTAGIYIILKMIEAKVPGVYVVHNTEESGCIGSGLLVESSPDWLDHVKIAISFDRAGYEDVITHQMGVRTCSDEFADSLSELLGMNYQKNTGGVYTDSNEYRFAIPECTNISVGYFKQHTPKETQDLWFLKKLTKTLIAADWSKLVVKRDPHTVDRLYTKYTFGNNYYDIKDWVPEDKYDEANAKEDSEIYDIYQLIKENPFEISQLLFDLGYSAYDILDEVQDYKAKIKTGRGFS